MRNRVRVVDRGPDDALMNQVNQARINAAAALAAAGLGPTPPGPPVIPPTRDYAMFYSVTPSATTAPGANMAFPVNGPTSAGGITRLSTTTFNLAAVGTYEVSYQVSDTTGATQLQLLLVGLPPAVDVPVNGTVQPQSVVGRAVGATQLAGDVLITTTVPNTILAVNNPAGNANTIVQTPPDGTETKQNAATLVIKRLS
jgi:hypothetical protein